MELIFYCTEPNDFSLGLLNKVRALVQLSKLVVCGNFKELKNSLLKPEYDLFAAILIVSNGNDLSDLLSIAQLLRSIQIILIIPDREKKTISKAHALRPRFLTWPASNSNEVVAVLAKILGNVENCQNM